MRRVLAITTPNYAVVCSHRLYTPCAKRYNAGGKSVRTCPRQRILVYAMPRKFRLRFGMRTLIVSVLIGGAVFGLIAARTQRARSNRERVAAVEKEVQKEVAESERRGRCTMWPVVYEVRRPATWLEQLLDDPGDSDDPVRVLKVWALGVTTETYSGLEHLKGLTNLTGLFLDNTEVTDADLKCLEGLTKLEYLSVRGTKVTGAGLENLTGLTNLKGLDLSYASVNDAGLEHLKGLANLESLDLSETNVTDASLRYIKGLTNLETLALADTKVTDEGVKGLRKALSNCDILHYR